MAKNTTTIRTFQAKSIRGGFLPQRLFPRRSFRQPSGPKAPKVTSAIDVGDGISSTPTGSDEKLEAAVGAKDAQSAKVEASQQIVFGSLRSQRTGAEP